MYRDLITIGQYYCFMEETGYPAPMDPSVHGTRNSAWLDGKPKPGTEQLPVSSVSWMILSLIVIGRKQVTERSRMEYAAAGAVGRVFPWGNSWDPKACRCAEETANLLFKTNTDWKSWLNGGGKQSNGLYPDSSWLALHNPQVDGPTRAGLYPKDTTWCGIRDMAGQVREWCSDCMIRITIKKSKRHNPLGPKEHGSNTGTPPARVMRGAPG